MNLDFKEFEKQRTESIIKSGEYCGMDILIGKGEKEPIAHLNISKVSPFEVAMLITSLKTCIVSIAKRYPLAYELSKRMHADTEEIDMKGEK